MAGEGSVAPKERVNITYKPATGDAQVEVELPLKLLILGDFTQREDDRSVEDRAPINVDKDNYNDVLKAQNLSLDLSVPNRLEPGSEDNLPVNLKFESLADFQPDSIVEKVPELRNIVELRGALKALKGPLGNIPDFRKKLQALVQDDETRARLLKELGIEDK
ncbi:MULTISPECIES: type VI secretion system contractile sheath small subunit [Alcaligenaceae]|jgi:type VI secretion system protein ImpB|uniref:Type VI secretion system-associated protein n=1 Tax=Neopusillimonas maritima TaxID=2026239 RepID=A0A3A1YXV3_9BURK|nr:MULTISPECIES: type VI secretion system contractile sheath small subunit [Alcaligenaceae]MAK54745.1 type VI secretion system contractile sheath small subunit [Pusillimonas sp.]MAL00548.1 type VI secretion system contractile sheath small subunit [Alcaligenaceae bacterium]MBF22232.1 type VI secretion system contractile sheath small subunit [Pusillimonas sp.]QIM48528.1 type VI secretion system contractile sheath small subunit [Pusillimonas sp. DMV24BSW_D]RII82400.1 type VI secretion system-asso|tara:strand:- start:5265 stop:5753 length:489 start_codon:yes stop_codon:yes gene_type:complete